MSTDTDNNKQDELDRTLDGALLKYAAVEPRVGLEERVLAQMRAERSRDRDRTWWRWSVMSAAAAIVMVVIALALKSGKPSHPQVAHRAPTNLQVPNETTRMISNENGNGVRVRKQRKDATDRITARRSQPQVIVASNPKLDQFPSSQPLSEQEKMLANYVARYPENAALIAQARTEALRKDRLEEMRDAAAGDEQDSEHQDR
jgi:hypothetical protein